MVKTAVIAESNRILSAAISEVLSILEFTVAAKTDKESDIIALVEKWVPDLLIYDFNLAGDGMNGIDRLNVVKKRFPAMKILVLGFHEAPEYEASSKNAGMNGFWNKLGGRAEFIEKLHLLEAQD